jgi:ABC-type glycerol-3-phosphate transport system substrate-binding protein
MVEQHIGEDNNMLSQIEQNHPTGRVAPTPTGAATVASAALGDPKTRRRVFGLLAGVAAVPATLIGVAACGVPGASGPGENVASKSPAPVTLAAWTWVSGAEPQQRLQSLSDGITAEAPHITAKWAFQGPGDGASALEKLLIAMAGGSPPEVSMMQEAWIPQIGTEPTLLVLDPYLKQSKLDLTDYIPSARSYMQFGDGKVRYLPWYFSPVALFHNAAHLKEAGITRAPQSWDEMLEQGRRLTRTEGDRVTRSGLDLGANDWHWLLLLWGAVG